MPISETPDAAPPGPAALSAADPPKQGPNVHPGAGRAESDGDAADAVPDFTRSNTASGNQVGHDLTLAETIYNGDTYNIVAAAQRRTVVRQFSLTDGRVATEVEEERAVQHFAGMENDAEPLVTHLEARRILLLSADAGARKVTAATGLALALRSHGLCSRPPLMVDPPDRHTRIRLHDLPRHDEALRNRVVIFRRALSRGNPDLAEAFARTDRAQWEELGEALRRRGSFLVLTATPGEAAAFAGAPGTQALHRPLPPHTPGVLAERLETHLAALGLQGTATPEAVRALRDASPRLVTRFRFASQLLDFVDYFVGLGESGVGLDEALTRFHDTSRRLLLELDDDFEGWSFGFTLALAQCTPDAAGVPWVEFDRLRRSLHRWLRQDLRLADTARPDDLGDEPGEVRLAVSDASLLARAQAVVEKDGATLSDVVRFRDGSPPGVLWSKLLDGHRRVLSALLPRLRDLAERASADGDDLRVRAAQILGRIGEMDPRRIFAPLAERWAGLDRGRQQMLLGALCEGAMSSGDERYRAYVLDRLAVLHAVAPPDADERSARDGSDEPGDATTRGGAARARRAEALREYSTRVVAAAVAYSWLGDRDLALVMPRLHTLARAHLVPPVESAAAAFRQEARERAAVNLRTRQGEARARLLQRRLREEIERTFARRGEIFVAVQHTLLTFCVAHGVAEVARHLRDWIARDGEATGVVLALMFYREGGLAEMLDGRRGPAADGSGAGASSPVPEAIVSGGAGIHHLTRFLADLHESARMPWNAGWLVGRLVDEQLPRRLVGWLLDVASLPDPAPDAACALVRQLTRTHGGQLREAVTEVLESEELRAHPRYEALAAAMDDGRAPAGASLAGARC